MPKPTKDRGHASKRRRTKPETLSAHTVLPVEARAPDAIPGVNKLKSSIRQAKRLLARDTLEPSLRVTTQRRLTALEADLESAERREVEKKNGAKYHAIKFFERQKLQRIVKRLKRKLGEEELKDKKKKSLEADLEEARVMLNYIINFPNALKYISLFPAAKEGETEEKEGKSLPPYLKQTLEDELDKPTRQRLEMLLEARRLMTEGKLSATPESDARDPKARVEIASVPIGKKRKHEDEKADEEDDFFGDD